MRLRYTIVNADDFGRTAGINDGVQRAFEHGIVTSASLMVRWPAAEAAAAYARLHLKLSVGLHLDLGEWVYRDSDWIRLYRVVDENDASAVSEEIVRQLETFERLARRAPTHIDSHQHVHLKEPVRSCVLAVADRLNVPVRGITPLIHHCGRFYGQDVEGRSFPRNISIERLVEILSTLEPGLTEIGCHPATYVDSETAYSAERTVELQTLCDPDLRCQLAQMGTELCSFANWRAYAR